MRLPLLLSYWYFKDIDVAEWLGMFTHPPLVFADSGAFSAHSQGKDLDIGGYIAWLERWKHLFTHYVMLDVKGDVDAGLKNLALMEMAKLKPVPVFHGGEDFSILTDMCRHYDYVALGNIARTVAGNSNNTAAWLAKCFQIGAEYKTVFHGFGMTTPRHLWTFPWYSVDSSSWSAGFRYGAVAIYLRSERRVIYLRNVKREPQHRVLWEKHRADVARHGQHIYDFMHNDIRSNERYASVGAVSFALMGQHIRQTRPRVEWPGETEPISNPGPTLYLAAQGLPANPAKGTKGRAWYELTALHFLDDNLELYQ